MSEVASINHIKARIEVECRRSSITVSELARRTGRSPQALRDILVRGNPTLSTIREIAAALEVDMEELIRPVTAEEYGAAHIPTNV